jgi:hypothetical protein
VGKLAILSLEQGDLILKLDDLGFSLLELCLPSHSRDLFGGEHRKVKSASQYTAALSQRNDVLPCLHREKGFSLS